MLSTRTRENTSKESEERTNQEQHPRNHVIYFVFEVFLRKMAHVRDEQRPVYGLSEGVRCDGITFFGYDSTFGEASYVVNATCFGYAEELTDFHSSIDSFLGR